MKHVLSLVMSGAGMVAIEEVQTHATPTSHPRFKELIPSLFGKPKQEGGPVVRHDPNFLGCH